MVAAYRVFFPSDMHCLRRSGGDSSNCQRKLHFLFDPVVGILVALRRFCQIMRHIQIVGRQTKGCRERFDEVQDLIEVIEEA